MTILTFLEKPKRGKKLIVSDRVIRASTQQRTVETQGLRDEARRNKRRVNTGINNH